MTKNQIIKYLKSNEVDVQRAHAFLFICDLAYTSYSNSKLVHTAEFSPIFCHLSYGSHEPHYQLISKRIIDNVGRGVWEDYLKNKKSLDERINYHQELLNKFDLIWRDFSGKNWKTMKREEFLSIYKLLVSTAEEWWKYASVGEEKGHVIDNVVVARFAKRHGLTIEAARKIVHILSNPREKSIFSSERKDFLKLVLSIRAGKSAEKEIKEYIKKYFWIKTDFCRTKKVNRKTILFDIKKELKKHSFAAVKNELNNMQENDKKAMTARKDILRKMKLSQEDREDLYFAERIIYWVDSRKKGMLHHMFYLWSFFEIISRRFDISYEEINMHTLKEAEKFIRTGQRVGARDIRKRLNGMFIDFETKKQVKTFLGHDSKEILSAITKARKVTEVKGMVASAGNESKVVGRVGIVMNIKRDKFRKGDILVTSMTRPEFVSLMRLARAVITDEGGIACHAAIISREMGKPCIIGTKISTKEFKSGDRVEMDMEKGIIKIIK